MDEPLSIWVIYDHPLDYPDCYVARRHVVTEDGPQITDDAMFAPLVETLRGQMRERGLTPVARFPDDDPVIMETWL